MTKLVLSLAIMLPLLALVGCSDDPAATVEMATVVIDASPNGTSVQWRLNGLSASSGVGDKSLEVYPGPYTLTWFVNDEWVNLGESQVTLRVEPGGRYVVEGTFFRDAPAHVKVDVEPDELDQGWVVTLADGQQIAGTGDADLPVDHSGRVSISWIEQPGWWIPIPLTMTGMALGDTVTFRGLYQERLVDPAARSVCIPSGAFLMGSPEDELGRVLDETQHEVTLTRRIWIDREELDYWSYIEAAVQATIDGAAYMEIFTVQLHDSTFTDTLYYQDNENISAIVDYSPVAMFGRPVSAIHISAMLDGSDALITEINPPNVSVNLNPGAGLSPLASNSQAVLNPIIGISWYGAAAYCDWLNVAQDYPRSYDHGTWEILGGDPYALEGFRLPTEAEWEYACRAGTTTAFASGGIGVTGVGDRNLNAIAWYGGGAVRNGGLKIPNDFGLYDMHGNVWEWCNDWYEYFEYSRGDVTDPRGPASGTNKCKRGGDVASGAAHCRSANRSAYDPNQRATIGFRPVRTYFE
ncbi:formylglycine-generating enzyme family protein [bacterium]|nr:formylglycine-generating enzyme family protein [bacterium]